MCPSITQETVFVTSDNPKLRSWVKYQRAEVISLRNDLLYLYVPLVTPLTSGSDQFTPGYSLIDLRRDACRSIHTS